jgi:hypothetical protein
MDHEVMCFMRSVYSVGRNGKGGRIAKPRGKESITAPDCSRVEYWYEMVTVRPNPITDTNNKPGMNCRHLLCYRPALQSQTWPDLRIA